MYDNPIKIVEKMLESVRKGNRNLKSVCDKFEGDNEILNKASIAFENFKVALEELVK